MKRIIPPYEFLTRNGKQEENIITLSIKINPVSGEVRSLADKPVSIFIMLRALIVLMMAQIQEMERQSSMLIKTGGNNAEESDNDAENGRNDRSESSTEPGGGSGDGGTCS